MDYNLEINNLEKKYHNFTLKDINITVPKGKIVGFIGENGSGKTTTTKAIFDTISIDSGSIKIFGKSHKKLTKKDKENIGVVLDDSFFSHVLNVDDINNLMKRFYTTWDEDLYYQYVKEFNIPTDIILKNFSSGMKMKIKVVCAICHKPKLLILDEPTNGLDPVIRYELLQIFEKFVQNGENSIFISSHITSDLEHIADEIIFIDNGHILLDMEKKELFDKYGIIECSNDEFNKIDKKYYDKCIKYKDEYMLLIDDKKSFSKQYSKMEIKKPSIEELMLLFIKGDK